MQRRDKDTNEILKSFNYPLQSTEIQKDLNTQIRK